jgi:hypothetical protein
MAPLARGKAEKVESRLAIVEIDGNADQPKGGEAYRRRHSSDLPIAALLQTQLDPARRDGES